VIEVRWGPLAKAFWILGSPFAWFGLYRNFVADPGVLSFLQMVIVVLASLYFIVASLKYRCVISTDCVREEISFGVFGSRYSVMENACDGKDVVGLEEWGRIIWRPMAPVDIVCADGTRISIQKMHTNYDEALQFVEDELLDKQE
jgi:hypothetical protein